MTKDILDVATRKNDCETMKTITETFTVGTRYVYHSMYAMSVTHLTQEAKCSQPISRSKLLNSELEFRIKFRRFHGFPRSFTRHRNSLDAFTH